MITFHQKNPPREFSIKNYTVKDHGTIELEPDQNTNEFVSFRTSTGRQCDFAATSWGFYLGPSINSRLKEEGFRVALVVNDKNQLYVMAVEPEKMDEFYSYLDLSNARVVSWLENWFED